MGKGFKAWITSARNDEEGRKAEVVGWSLRRAGTAQSLAIIVRPSVSSSLKKKLNEVFDLVYLTEPENGKQLFPKAGQNDWAVATAFSLKIFEACVYLSPDSIVKENADEIFERNCMFSATLTKAKGTNDLKVDTSVLYFKPGFDFRRHFGNSTDLSEVLTKLACSSSKENLFQPLEPEYNVTPSNPTLADSFILGSRMCILNYGQTTSDKFLEKGKPASSPEMFLEKVRCEILKEIESCREIGLDEIHLRSSAQSEPIAVIGLSFRFPGANNVDEFTDLLLNGKEGIRPLPTYRWTKKHSYYPCEMRNVEGGFLNFPIDEFDTKFFGISPMDAEYLDPQQRLLHEVSWEALEDAMIDPLSLKGTQTSFFVGSWMHDYQTIATNQADSDFFRVYMGNSIGASAARLSHFYETMGPSVATESGCSASIVAVDMAVKSLRRRETDLALACGVNLFLHPFDKSKFSFVISPNGRCKTFDAGADGFGRAEGCAVLVLKRLPEAIRDGNNIWGVIRGSAIRQEGMSKSMGTPTVQCESLVMELALKDAGVEPKDVSYVEAHGTGTPVGDPLEIAAITRAYSKGRSDPLVIGSVKTNIGHTESVSGITGIIKVLLSMKTSTIPKHLNLKTLNPEINLSPIPAKIPIDPIPWPKTNERKRIAGVSSFGISGTDGHVIVEEPPTLPKASKSLRLTAQSDRPLHILKISAKSSESLSKKLKNYKELLSQKANEIKNGESNGDAFADVAFSANTGRSTFNHRAVIIASNFSDAAKIIEEEKVKQAVCFPSAGNKLCFLFTGQGSQYPNMASTLYKTSPVFKHYFDKCDEYLNDNYSISLQKVLWENSEEVNRTIYSQTSIFVVEYCLLKLWESWGIKPDFVLGHSLGEFAAAVAAGILNFSDAIKLVAERSRLIDSLPQGKMLVIKADKKTVNEAIKAYQQNNKGFWADYAAFNSIDQTVIAGDSVPIEEFATFCKGKGLKNIVLASTHAFHSRHMDPVLEEYGKVCSSVEHLKPGKSAPIFISAVDGKIVEPSSINADYWIRHTREKVNFIDACKVLKAEQCNLFLEVGPHPILSALTMMNIDSPVTCLPSLRKKEDDWTTLLDSLSKLYLSDWKGAIDWNGFDKVYDRKRVPVPFYQFNKKSVWTKFLKLYPKIHPLLGSILPNAASETMYESILTLKNTEFIKDHVIGDTVIFPGSAFLEMCLVGGHAAVQGSIDQLFKPRRPVSLKNFTIYSPLAFRDSETCSLQTIIKMGDSDDTEIGYRVEVHHHIETEDGEGSEEWLRKASATYSSSVPVLPGDIAAASSSIDLEAIQKTWKSFDENIKRFYDMLSDVGLKFGPRFQSIESGWINDSSILTKLKVPEEDQAFLTHPIITDAMFQTMMVSRFGRDDKKKKKLFVPITVKEFIWLGEVVDSPNLYLFSTTNDEKESFCVLINENCTPLAYMKEPEFMETTVKLVEQVVQKQGNKLPGMWKEQWKPYPSPLENQAVLNPMPEVEHSQEDLEKLEAANNIDESETRVYSTLVKLPNLYFMMALDELGWKPQIGDVFKVDGDLLSKLKIKPLYSKYLLFYCKQFVKEGYLKYDEAQDKFTILKCFPPKIELTKLISNLEGTVDQTRGDAALIIKVGHRLGPILSGSMDPLQVLFPEKDDEPSAAKYYTCAAQPLKQVGFEISNLVTHFWFGGREKRGGDDSLNSKVIRVLEVGAGTGAGTKLHLDILENLGMKYEYHYTDISSVFFDAARENLKDYKGNLIFNKFDMETDPFQQSFTPQYFDAIIAVEVLHVATNIGSTLESLRMLLKPRGSLFILEHIIQDPRTSFAFGCLSGFWQCQDRLHPHLEAESWKEHLHSTGFETVLITPYYNNVHGIIFAQASATVDTIPVARREFKNSWLIFDSDDDETISKELRVKLHNVNRNVVTFKRPRIPEGEGNMETLMKAMIESQIQACTENGRKLEGIVYLWALPQANDSMRSQSLISLPLITLCQTICGNEKCKPRIYVVTQGLATFDPLEVTDPNPGTVIGVIRCIYNELPSLKITNVDIGLEGLSGPKVEELIFANMWTDFKLPRVALRGEHSFVPKLVGAKCENLQNLTLPNGCDRFQLQLPKTRLISDLEYTYLEPYSLGENEVEVCVQAIGLNFRDVFTVLKPIKAFEDFNAVGFEFAGVISQVGKSVKRRNVGDRVIGLNLNRNLSMPSHIKLPETMVVSLPENMTFAEGATLPTAFCTSHYCLVELAKLKEGETVLIHTASGAVGLCAIQLAQKARANIIATAGSPRKRRYLKDLGVEHVFNSRTTEFGNQILEVTKGRGVDVILNTLTGEGYKEASLNALGKRGRFIEISKLNVWEPEEVKQLRPDVYYECVDLTTFDATMMEERYQELETHLNLKGYIKPISHETFEALNIRGALNYMQKAKHIGKVVCIMPKVTIDNLKFKVTTPIFNPDSTYMVTGGLGGIGFEVVTWMLKNGAKHIAIISRRQPNPTRSSQIDHWNKTGSHVQVFPVDIGDLNQCRELFSTLSSPHSGFPTVRGVMHAAGVLHDGLFENQSWSTFQETYNPKVNGTWNLHLMTKDLVLEHFLLFSSITSVFGSAGQANHCASNSFEDMFANYRKSIGLPASSINWGNWGEVGVATEIDFPGLRPISTFHGLLALQTLMVTQDSHVAVLNVDSFAKAAATFPTLNFFLDDSALLGEVKTSCTINSDEFWQEIDEADGDEAVEIFTKYIKMILRNTLKMGRDENIDSQADFQSLGIDSLMMLELKNSLQNMFGSRLTLSAAQLRDCSNTAELATKLVRILENENDGQVVLPTPEELKLLIRTDANLLPEVTGEPRSPAKDISQVETVMITMAAGTLALYMLKDLSRRQGIKQIYCLMRPTKKMTCLEILKERLASISILEEVDLSKVKCIEGDITSKKLNMPSDVYSQLAEEVDAVFHYWGKVDFIAKYWNAPESMKQDIRTVNVVGTSNVIEFVVTSKTKHLLFPSTVLCVTEVNKDGNLLEDWQDVGAMDVTMVTHGYPLSKHICEQMIKKAADLYNFPCKVIRHPYIAGDSKTGRTSLKNNHQVLRWLVYMRLGCMPFVPTPMCAVAVDKSAELSLDIFFSSKAPSGVYHLMPQLMEVEQEIIQVAREEFGVTIEPVEASEFVEKLKAEGDDSPIASYLKMYAEDVNVVLNPEFSAIESYRNYLESSGNLNKVKLTELVPKAKEGYLETLGVVMRRELKYLKDNGLFEKFGIRAKS